MWCLAPLLFNRSAIPTSSPKSILLEWWCSDIKLFYNNVKSYRKGLSRSGPGSRRHKIFWALSQEWSYYRGKVHVYKSEFSVLLFSPFGCHSCKEKSWYVDCIPCCVEFDILERQCDVYGSWNPEPTRRLSDRCSWKGPDFTIWGLCRMVGAPSLRHLPR